MAWPDWRHHWGSRSGFLLHDAGFDVWLYNARGTTPSRRHETLHTWRAKFWDFSLHEIAIGDLPATIDFVLKNTGQPQVGSTASVLVRTEIRVTFNVHPVSRPQLHYVGYSQGSTLFFILGSERPEYMEKVKSFVALAPVAYLRDVRSFPLRLLAVVPNSLYVSDACCRSSAFRHDHGPYA